MHFHNQKHFEYNSSIHIWLDLRMRCDEATIEGQWKASMLADHVWRTITGTHGIDEMRVDKSWNETCSRGKNGKNLEKNLARSRFVYQETHMEWPSRELGTPAMGGETQPLAPRGRHIRKYQLIFILNLRTLKFNMVRRRGADGRIPAYQPDGPGSIPGCVRIFNSYPETGCVSFVCVLCCVVSDGGPDILLITDSGSAAIVYLSSGLVQSLCSLYRHLTHGHFGWNSRGGGKELMAMFSQFQCAVCIGALT